MLEQNASASFRIIC